MQSLENKNVLVVGIGASGEAACRLLRSRSAEVVALDEARSQPLERAAADLRRLHVKVELGAEKVPLTRFDLAVLSPGVPLNSKLAAEIKARDIPIIGELELGFQQSCCLSIAVTGTNGKTTTTELIAAMLAHASRKTIAAGNIGTPVCSVVDQTKELDFLTLEVSSFQLETSRFFRPAIAVLLNITPDHMDRHGTMAEYTRAKARIFENQQAFDWAIVQSEALAQIRSMSLPVPSKIITFSANNRRADIHYDRGLLISRIPDWSGLLVNIEECKLRGPHNAENLMAALAVGRVLKLRLDEMLEVLKTFEPAPHRCELVAEHNGVQFVNDSKATNLDAVGKALMTVRGANAADPNVWLIAGGKDKGLDFHDIGPILARRVKHAYLLGETRERIRAAWSLFTPCTLVNSIPEAISLGSQSAAQGDVVLLSPACSSFDMFKDYQHRGECFREAVRGMVQTAGRSQ
jgi:UDP-N-acetylmuramoylalanine--D-glutamate ligase